MADTIPIYQRQVMPQGRLQVPSGETTLGESFGAGFGAVGQGIDNVAQGLAAQARFVRQQQDKKDQTTATQAVLQFSNETDAAMADAQQKAPPGAAGFVDQSLQDFDKKSSEFIAKIPPSAQDYAKEQILRMRGGVQNGAMQFQVASGIAHTQTQLEDIQNQASTMLVNDPSKLDFAKTNVITAIKGLKLPPAREAEALSHVDEVLSTTALGSLTNAAPRRALAEMKSGKWDVVNAKNLQGFENQATQQIKADDAQARSEARQREAEAKANFNIVFDDAVSTAAATGTQNTVTEADIDKHYSGAAAVVLKRQLATAQAEGVAGIEHAGTSPQEDQAWLDANAPKPGQTFTADQGKIYETGAKVIAAKQAAFAGNNPAEAALSTSPAVVDAWDAVRQAPDDKVQLRQAIALTQAEQQRQGVANPQPIPASIATGIVGRIMSQPAPKDQLDALLQFTDFGDAKTTSAVLGQLTAVKGGLPDGTDLVIDIAQSDRAKAERVWTTLKADTKGVTLPKEGNDAVSAGLNSGLFAVLKGQSDITGNADASAALAGPVLNAATQYAKAKVLVGGDPAAAGTQAVQDLTGQYALIHDSALAEVYYPQQIEAQAPGAVEAGLAALRTDAAAKLAPKERPGAAGTKVTPNPYIDATIRDIGSSAVWVNHGAGFALIIPGSTRALSFVTYEQARDRGIAALKVAPQSNTGTLPSSGPATFVPLQ